jgi:hypothetical protein
MCTVTAVPYDGGVRLLCNRDERRTRLPANPPQIHVLSGQRALFPQDPQGGGTWIGVNEAGVAVALLNLRPAFSTRGGLPQRSRGLIVLELLRCTSLDQAISAANSLDTDLFGPFRVVVVHGRQLAVAASSGTGVIECAQRSLDAPALFTSSSLGDDVAGPPRQRLFEGMVLRGPAGWLDGQTRFHHHQWPRNTEISVRMERADALTVSRTQIEVTSHSRRLQYEAPLTTCAKPRLHQWCSLD